jgi:hypothetical protein
LSLQLFSTTLPSNPGYRSRLRQCLHRVVAHCQVSPPPLPNLFSMSVGNNFSNKPDNSKP